MWNTTLGSIEHEYSSDQHPSEKRTQLDEEELPWENAEGERPQGEDETEDDDNYEVDRQWIEENRTLIATKPGIQKPGSWIHVHSSPLALLQVCKGLHSELYTDRRLWN